MPALVIIILFAMFVFYETTLHLLFALLPTFLNAGVSFLLVAYLRCNFAFKIFLAVIISLLLTLNVRISGILSDREYIRTTGEIMEVKRKVKIPQQEFASLVASGASVLEFKANKLDAVYIKGWNGVWFQRPPMVREIVEDVILGHGIAISKEDGNPVKIVIDIHDNNKTVDVSASIWDGDEKTAYYKNRFRKAYPLEHADNVLSNLAIYFTQYTFWNIGFTEELYRKSSNKHPLKDFLEKTIEIIPQKAPPQRSLQAKLINTDNKSIFYSEKEYPYYRTSDLIGCDNLLSATKDDWPRDFLFKAGNGIRPVNIKVMPQRITCQDDEVFMIFGKKEGSEIFRYSPKGDLLSDDYIKLPKIAWKGNKPKVLVEFKKTLNAYELTLMEIEQIGDKFKTQGYNVLAKHKFSAKRL